MPQIKIHTIICNVPDESDKDEIFLKCNGQKIWPEKSRFLKIGVDEALDVNVNQNFDGDWLELELWDFDYTSRNDHLGTFHLDLTQGTGHFGTILSNNADVSEEADYMINWEILAK
ncbi:hypothetical protein [Ekhidna sp. To15]|uniref:hypothetical protein n=1 Tax=Ekhidna sp. To15 TaxID=3395267 RepID=UPI003F52663E